MADQAKQEVLRWRSHWYILGLALHYLITAYNHTLSAFINFTPPFSCQDSEYAGHQGCVYSNSSGSTKDACQPGYVFNSSQDVTTSIVTEWSLVCEDRLYQPMVTTLYFVGVTLGALVTGILADKMGRKPLVVICLYAQAALGVIISLFTYSFVMYILLRAVQGFFVQGLQSCTYTLVLELIPTQHRTAMGVVAELYWGVGLMLLSLASFYISQWRTLQLVLSVFPVVASAAYIWKVPESKIWLQSKGFKSKSSDELQKKIKHASNNYDGQEAFKTLPRGDKNDAVEDLPSLESVSSEREARASMELKVVLEASAETQTMFGAAAQNGKQERHEDVVLLGRDKYVLEVLWLSKGLRKYNIVMVVNWFSTMIAYYTITFHIPNLSGDRHVNFFLGALVEIAAYAVAYIVLSRLGRRLPLSFYQLVGGVISCTVAAIPADSWAGGAFTTAITLLGKGAIVSSFCCLCLYTSELFPTTVRAAALGHCAFWGRIGSLLAPQLIVLGDYTSRSVPLVGVGIISVFTCFIVLALPETLGRPLPNTLHDIENLNRAQERKTTR